MSTAAQVAANIENSKLSTGPRTDVGKAASSRNGITHGLHARRDFIRPDDEHVYVKLQADLQSELNPAGVQEQTLVDEIRRATWRLHRCGEVEANLTVRLDDGEHYILDPMESPGQTATIQNSVDRARSQAHRLLHKCTAELRKLQAERKEQSSAAQPAVVTAVVPAVATMRTQSESTPTGRNTSCPCNSGQKYKRCCGRNAPPLRHAA